MSEYTAQTDKATESYLTTVAKVQDEMIKTVTSFIQQLPKTPELPGMPTVNLPTPSEITAASFDFAEKVFAQNRTYSDQLIAVLEPAKV